MIGKIYITDVIGQDTTLLDVIRQRKSQKEASEFLVVIDSVGGYADEGFAIYDYLKGLDVPVHTLAKSAYSIASVIYMAGQRRIVDENAENVLMIHLPWVQPEAGSYDQIVNDIQVLKEVENRLIGFYSREIELPKDTIKQLLANETYLDSAQALSLGFATETKAIATAMAQLSPKHNIKEDRSLMTNLKRRLDAIAKSLGIKNELMLQDANGVELVFPELSSADEPFIDDKATVDGKPAEGEFLMPDGKTFKFANGTVSEITIPAADDEVPAEDSEEVAEEVENADEEVPTEEAPAEDDADALKAENEELKAKVAELEAKLAELQGGNETQDKLLEILTASTAKNVELEKKYEALAKSIGSNYQPSEPKNVASATIKAEGEEKPKFSISRKPLKK